MPAVHRGDDVDHPSASNALPGSFPPRECGIATFMKDVVDSYDARFRHAQRGHRDRRARRRRARLSATKSSLASSRTIATSYDRIADFVNAHPCDVLNIQHEYGLFGGDDGEWVVDLIARVRQAGRRFAAHRAARSDAGASCASRARSARASSAVVVLSETGRDILIDRYGVDPAEDARDPSRRSRRSVPRHVCGAKSRVRLRRAARSSRRSV